MAAGGKEKKIVVAHNGPFEVTGGVPLRVEVAVPNDEGDPVEWQQGEQYTPGEEYALCRCGHSHNKPFCDGSHVRVGFDGTETCDKELYSDKCGRLSGPGLDLTDARRYCSGARFCHPEGGIKYLVEHSDDNLLEDFAVKQACNCPSGRLVAWRGGEPVETEFEQSISVTQDPGAGVSGPYWVKGGIRIEAEDGQTYERRNRVTLCRCGQSKNKVLCDGTHRKVGFKDWVEEE